ncbi:hypothetical protein GFC01_00580 [Desulfofundulus thermobenzoicus]|uniref:Uncharacterized protein n=1 Tax=Desulfofundulus thermobenzoicus TaxID=29376 RepID=A0A6N7IN90_9FIRM|nr:hypothetical protein [Desulfofundulus thermobenzoicus]MQL50798.1 hypothetical protein [Desulfofundulus thermobenzoicus]
MKVFALAWFFLRDHFRTYAVWAEVIIIALFLAIFFGPTPKQEPHTWASLAVGLGFFTIVLSAVCTTSLIWRNADSKMTVFMLKAGKTAYYTGLLLASLSLSAFWIAIVTACTILVLPLSGHILPLTLLAAVTGNLFVVTGLFILFSSLTGRAIDPVYAVILVLLGLGSYFFNELGGPWIWLNVFLPPLLSNINATTGASSVPIIRSLTYFTVTVALGLIRFTRREFIWS